MHLRVSTAVLGILVAFAPLLTGGAEASVVVGGPAISNNGNCYPFGCSASEYGNQYQQVYSASAFSGPLDITSLSFYNTQYMPGTATPDMGTFQIYLSNTSVGPTSINTDPALNIGPNQTLVYSGSLPSLIGNVLTINLTQGFAYDAASNLLLTVISADGVQTGTRLYLDAGNTDVGREYRNAVDYNYGLITGFDVGGTTVPLPASAPMFGAALLTLGVLGYRMKGGKRSAI